MDTDEVLIPIPGRLHSVAESGHVAGADDIYDDSLGKSQGEINGEVNESLGAGGSVDERIASAVLVETERAQGVEATKANATDVYTKNETYSKTELNSLITTPSQQYITVAADDQTTAVTDVLPATGAADTIYRVGSWDGAQYDATVYSEYAWNASTNSYMFLDKKECGIDDVPTAGSDNLVKSGGVQNELSLGAVYDVSAKNPTAGTNNDGKWESLSALLSDANLNTLIPTSVRKGGMSIKFVQTSDNKYVQYRYMGTETTGNPNPFLDTVNWQGVDDELISGSKNLAESGLVQKRTVEMYDLFADNVGCINKSGDRASNSDFLCTDYIRIKAGDSYKAQLTYGETYVSACYVYDINKEHLGEFLPRGYSASSFITTIVADDIFTQYPSAAYIRLSGKNVDINNAEYPYIIYNIKRVEDAINDRINDNVLRNGIYHVNAPTDTSNTYTLETAIAAVPQSLRSVAKVIVYRTATDGTQIAVFNSTQYYSEFTTAANWTIINDEKYLPLASKGMIFIKRFLTLAEQNVNEAIREIKFIPPTGKENHDFAIRCIPKNGTQTHYYVHDITADNICSFINNKSLPISGIVQALLPSDGRSGWEDAMLYVDIDFDILSAQYYPSAANENFKLKKYTRADLEVYCKEQVRELDNRLKVDVKETLTIIDGYYSGGQNLVKNAEWRVIEYNIPDVNNVYWASGSVRPSATRLVDYLESNGAYISSECFGTGTLTYYDRYKLTIPKNAAKLRITSYKDDEPELFVGVKSDLDSVNYNLENRIAKVENHWKGKTIWWCGTSIPCGNGDNNYPRLVGLKLGATTINKAEGGSMCRANVRFGNYNGANFENITSALSMTNEEVEDFIANYDTYKALPWNTAWPDTLSDAYKARLRAASFENRLLPYLNGTYPMPDLFVIDHGHNDFKYNYNGVSDITLEPTLENVGENKPIAEDTFMTVNSNAKLVSFLGSLDDIPSDKLAEFVTSLNRNCYIGAMNFIVTLILKYNPRARIVFISNYEYEHGNHPEYAPLITAQNSIANSWAFPLCEVYKYLGFSNHYIPGSKSVWNKSKDVTVFNIYCPDGVHPHSDNTGYANGIYAGILAEFLKTCR